MAFATLCVWLGWAYVLFRINPVETDWMGFLFFYMTLGMALVGTLTILATAVRRLFHRDHVVSRQVLASFRQSVFFTVLILGTMIMMSHDVFRWWTVLLFVFVLALLELIFLSFQRPKPVQTFIDD